MFYQCYHLPVILANIGQARPQVRDGINLYLAFFLFGDRINNIGKDMLDAKEKEKVVKEFRVHEKDTGSSEVQIALLSKEIKGLLSHLKKHPKDFHSKRGLLKMVAKRKKLLTYLKKKDAKKYNSIIKKIGLKK